MALQEGTADGDASGLPTELSGARPFPLPRWAKRGSATGYATLGLAVIGAAGVHSADRVRWLAVIPIGLAVAGVGLLWIRRRARNFLQTGSPVVGRVDRTLAASGTLQVQYSYQATAGALTGRFVYDVGNVVRDFGMWPEPGDRVFLIVDATRPSRRTVWGFAPPRGRQARSPPVLHTPLPMKVVVAVVAAAIALVVGVFAWIALRG